MGNYSRDVQDQAEDDMAYKYGDDWRSREDGPFNEIHEDLLDDLQDREDADHAQWQAEQDDLERDRW